MVIEGKFTAVHKHKKMFVNPELGHIQRSALDICKILIERFKNKNRCPIPQDYAYPTACMIVDETHPTATWIGHSTFFLEVDGVVFLTDPIWSHSCSPIKKLSPKRISAPPMGIDDLSRVDFIVISHNHYDHLDKPTVKALNKKFPDAAWIVPTGVEKWMHAQGVKRAYPLSWWQHMELKIADKPKMRIDITSVPAQHDSGRKVFDRSKTLWCGFVIDILRENGEHKNIYFAGDTGYNNKHFKAIGEKWKKIDLALLPIGAYAPRLVVSPYHVNPKEAVQIHEDTKASLSIAMHWDTFDLGGEHPAEPPYQLHLAIKEKKLDPSAFRVIATGNTLNW